MKIEVNIEKKYFFVIIAAIALLIGVFVVHAYGGNSPMVVGHSVNEINWNDEVPTLKAQTVIVSNTLRYALPEIITNNVTICMDDRPGLIYEVSNNKARVYVAGFGQYNDLGWNCPTPGVNDPGKGNENSAKVLFASWDWNDINVNKTIYIYAYDTADPSKRYGAYFTDKTPDNTRLINPTSFYGTAGAQYPSYKADIIFPTESYGTMRTAEFSFVK